MYTVSTDGCVNESQMLALFVRWGTSLSLLVGIQTLLAVLFIRGYSADTIHRCILLALFIGVLAGAIYEVARLVGSL